MTTDYNLLGDTDDRLVTRAREMAWSYRGGDGTTVKWGPTADILDELVERVYLLHELEQELAREKENAEGLQGLVDDLNDGIAEILGEARDERYLADDVEERHDLRKVVTDLLFAVRWLPGGPHGEEAS